MTSIIEWNETRVAKACLASFPFFGSRTLRKLWSAYPNPAWAWLASPEALIANGAPEQAAMKFSDWRASVDPEALIKRLDREGIRVLFRDDPGYPQSFQMSSNPPEILFVRGVLEDRPSVAVVGTRRMTSYGRQCVAAIVPDLVRSGLSIISGLALGVDAEAHKTAIENEGYTVAILGTGVDDDSIYPRENFHLAQRILSQGGAVISEFPIGTDSRREHFPMRNRLIATLSAATLVIEASEESGSLITAKSALEENREVLAVPGPIWSEQSRGSNQLIKLGAKVCTMAADVLEAIAYDRPELIAQARAELPLDETEAAILETLVEPLHIDRVAEILGLDAPTMSSKMALLEIKGLAKPIGGQMWMRKRN